MQKHARTQPRPNIVRALAHDMHTHEHPTHADDARPPQLTMAEPWELVWNGFLQLVQNALTLNGYSQDLVDSRLYEISFKRQEQGHQTPILELADDIHRNNNVFRGESEDRAPTELEAETLWADLKNSTRQPPTAPSTTPV